MASVLLITDPIEWLAMKIFDYIINQKVSLSINSFEMLTCLASSRGMKSHMKSLINNTWLPCVLFFDFVYQLQSLFTSIIAPIFQYFRSVQASDSVKLGISPQYMFINICPMGNRLDDNHKLNANQMTPGAFFFNHSVLSVSDTLSWSIFRVLKKKIFRAMMCYIWQFNFQSI